MRSPSGRSGSCLKAQGFRLQANQKTREGAQHPDRDAQFEHINETVETALAAGQPVISIDCKKKELVGDYKNGGREWEPTRQAGRRSRATTSPPRSRRPSPTASTTSPTTRGTCRSVCPRKRPQFSVASIRAWWEHLGRERFPNANRLTITADCGGGNSPRVHLWKVELQQLATRPALSSSSATSRRGPRSGTRSSTGCSRSSASTGAAGRCSSYEVILDLIASTTTSTGLKVYARLDPTIYTKASRSPRTRSLPSTSPDTTGIQSGTLA